MPCYCDTPDEDDQAEIERRCKVNMYFDVQVVMTNEQKEKANEMNIPSIPINVDGKDENYRLCKLCSILHKEQMEKISAYFFQIKWPHETLYDWYVQHCKDDKEFNSPEIEGIKPN